GSRDAPQIHARAHLRARQVPRGGPAVGVDSPRAARGRGRRLMATPLPDWDAAAAALQGAESVVVACHGTADGHAVASVLASSTAELVTRLLLDAGMELDADIATCLYAGVVTDTGRFQYANSSPRVLRLAADLLEYGVDAVKVAQEVFESSPFGYLKLVGRV